VSQNPQKPIYETKEWGELSESVREAITRTSQELELRLNGGNNEADNGKFLQDISKPAGKIL